MSGTVSTRKIETRVREYKVGNTRVKEIITIIIELIRKLADTPEQAKQAQEDLEKSLEQQKTPRAKLSHAFAALYAAKALANQQGKTTDEAWEETAADLEAKRSAAILILNKEDAEGAKSAAPISMTTIGMPAEAGTHLVRNRVLAAEKNLPFNMLERELTPEKAARLAASPVKALKAKPTMAPKSRQTISDLDKLNAAKARKTYVPTAPAPQVNVQPVVSQRPAPGMVQQPVAKPAPVKPRQQIEIKNAPQWSEQQQLQDIAVLTQKPQFTPEIKVQPQLQNAPQHKVEPKPQLTQQPKPRPTPLDLMIASDLLELKHGPQATAPKLEAELKRNMFNDFTKANELAVEGPRPTRSMGMSPTPFAAAAA